MTVFHRKPSLRAQFLEEKTQNLQLVNCPKSTLESPHSDKTDLKEAKKVQSEELNDIGYLYKCTYVSSPKIKQW